MKVGDLEVIQVLDGEWITPAAPGLAALSDDEFAIVADIDPAMAKQAKALVRREIEGAAIHVSSSHFPGLRFGRLMPGAGRRYWQWAPGRGKP